MDAGCLTRRPYFYPTSNPVKFPNVPFFITKSAVKPKNEQSTKGKMFNFFILNGACRNLYGNLHWSLKNENKTKYHAKLDIFLIDSEQIKYLDHFKIKVIPCKRKYNKWFHSEIGMNFAYIAINVRNFNRNADFRGNATSLNIKFRIYLLLLLSFRIQTKNTDLMESADIKR